MADEALAAVRRLMAAGRWSEARDRLAVALVEDATAERHDLLGATLWWLGEVRESLRHRERAFALYRESGSAATATALALDISVCYWANLDNDVAARGWLARAERLAAEVGDDGLRGWVSLVRGYTASEPTTQRALLESALAVGRSRADVDLELVALADLGLALVSTGELEDGFGLLDEAMAGTQGGGIERLETVVWTSCSMLTACSLVGDLHRARLWCDAADAFASEYGCPFLQARCRAHYGRVLVATGQWDLAEQQLHAALAMAADTGRGPRTEARTGLAELRLRQGRWEEAAALIDDADDSAAAASVAGEVHRALGDATRAVAVLRSCLTTLSGHHPDRATVLAALVDAHLACGELASARRSAVELERLVLEDSADGRSRTAGLAARASGLLAGARGDPTEAGRLLRVASAAFRAQDLPYDAARVRLELAAVLAGSMPAAAVVEAQAAHRRLEALGASRDADAAAALLRTLGVPTRPGPRALGRLSGREREVLALLEQGLTNPQIGERLFLSRKTVAHHVSSILQKLGLTSRVEAAAFAARRHGA